MSKAYPKHQLATDPNCHYLLTICNPYTKKHYDIYATTHEKCQGYACISGVEASDYASGPIDDKLSIMTTHILDKFSKDSIFGIVIAQIAATVHFANKK